jgi:polysaccharide export outer membrane protein
MPRFAPVVLLVLSACASSPSSSPETEPLRPAAPVARAVADSQNSQWRYELRPGDVLKIDVWRSTELSGEFIVGPNGKLLQPLYQQVDVVSLPPDTVRAHVGAFLSKFQSNPQFIVEPLYRVLVGGEVHTPGLYNVPQTTTISQAIAIGGGPTIDADISNVKLVRGHKVTIYDLTSVGLALDTLHVQSGDQVLVGRKLYFLRDYAGPIASLVTMFIAIGYYTRR